MRQMSPGFTYYDLLAVPRDATRADIRSAFRRFSLQVHPDVNQDDPEAHTAFRLIRHAHDILVDTALRTEYDSHLRKRTGVASGSPIPGARSTQKDVALPTVADTLDATLSHLNFVLWEIEDLLRSDLLLHADVAGKPPIAYLAQALGFLDRWVLGPGGQPDYFYEARHIRSGSEPVPKRFGIRDEHRPYVSISDYFYDVRIRFDRFVGHARLADLSMTIAGTPARLVDSIIETHDYMRHYVSEVQSVLAGDVETVVPFAHSQACFASELPR